MPVETPHPEYAIEAPAWEKIRDAIGGERAVKAKGTRYLPKLEDQLDAEYTTYITRAEWYGATKRTVDGLVGVVFRRPAVIILGEDAEMLRPELEAITRDKLPIETVAENLVREIIASGRSGILNDLPADGGKPYMALYSAETIINWQTTEIDGKEELSLVVLQESETARKADDPFVMETKVVFRELALDDAGVYAVRLWRKGDRDAFVAGPPVYPTRQGKRLDRIPFTFVGPFDLTPAVQRSPIEDIVDLNYHHYRAYADLQHGRHYTAMPTYYAVAPASDPSAGAAPAPFKVGPNRVWLVEPGADNRPGILEFTGQGLIFLERATDDIERQMSVLGARLLASPRKTAAEAAEVVQMRERGEHSMLANIVAACEDGLTASLKQWVTWRGRDPSGVQVKLNRDFIETALDPRMISALIRAYESGLLAKTVIVKIFEEGDILPTGITMDEALALLKIVGEVYVDPKLAADTMPAGDTPVAAA